MSKPAKCGLCNDTGTVLITGDESDEIVRVPCPQCRRDGPPRS